MKRFVLIIAVAVFCLSSCSSQDKYDEGWNDGFSAGYDDGWNEGFDDGFDEGLIWGALDGQDDVEWSVIYHLGNLEGEISEVYGWHPEEALMILDDFKKGEPVSEVNLHNAIDSINNFYYGIWDIITEIDEMDIDYEFS